eukprot:scaffold311798_cov22-Tisochrysis_lutea.AAC.3
MKGPCRVMEVVPLSPRSMLSGARDRLPPRPASRSWRRKTPSRLLSSKPMGGGVCARARSPASDSILLYESSSRCSCMSAASPSICAMWLQERSRERSRWSGATSAIEGRRLEETLSSVSEGARSSMPASDASAFACKLSRASEGGEREIEGRRGEREVRPSARTERLVGWGEGGSSAI